jgi:hypothetical protein
LFLYTGGAHYVEGELAVPASPVRPYTMPIMAVARRWEEVLQSRSFSSMNRPIRTDAAIRDSRAHPARRTVLASVSLSQAELVS